MTRENPKARYEEADLIDEADRGPGGGAQVESRRRLREAIEAQSRESGRLTGWIIALMTVQILVAAAQIVVAVIWSTATRP